MSETLVPPGDMPSADAIRAACLSVLDDVRPGIRRDGGDVALTDIVGDRVFIRLTGACTTCSLAGQTLGGIRRKLMQVLGWPVRVVPAVSE